MYGYENCNTETPHYTELFDIQTLIPATCLTKAPFGQKHRKRGTEMISK